MIRLTADQLAALFGLAQAGQPEEICGLIGGTQGRALQILPITNSLHSPVRFRMDAAEQLAAFLELEGAGLELLAIYHSHPAGPAVPSETDRAEFAYPGVWSIILSPVASGWQARAFDLAAPDQREIPIEIEDSPGNFSSIS